MTCGVCSPDVFREGSGRMFGYIVEACPSQIAMQTSRLHYMGAQHIFADFRSGNVRYRKGFNRVCKVMRPGDRLILATDMALGLVASRRGVHFDHLEKLGVEVFTLRSDYFGADPWLDAAPKHLREKRDAA